MKIIIGLAFVVLVVPLGAVYAGEHPIVFDLTVSDSTNIPEYINRFYTSAVAISGITAVVMIVIGAIYYVVSGGSQDKQREGKDIITSAIWGVVLLLGAYTILNTVNPELVSLSPPGGDMVTQYSCREQNLVKNECNEGESPVVPEDPGATPLCCVPGLGYIPPTTGISCPEELTSGTSSCGIVSATAKKTIRIIMRCTATGKWTCSGIGLEIKKDGQYAMWAYYPKDGNVNVVANLITNPSYDFLQPGKQEVGAACIVYAYKKREGNAWTSVVIPPELKVCPGFTR